MSNRVLVRGCRRWAALSLVACLLPHSAAADETAGRILSPSLGRPAFVEAGGELTISATLASGTVSEALLIHPCLPGTSYRLSIPVAPGVDAAGGAPFRVIIPTDIPPRTYDLEVRTGGSAVRARHCVAVGVRREPLRLVHLADMNIGDLSVPAFESRLVEEVNLLAPTAIIATGDLIDATHPQQSAAWLQMTESLCAFDAPLIIAAGDHDDGESFARSIAPSPIGVVELRTHRFIVLNDHALAPLARDSEQLRWAEAALRADCAGLRFVVSHGKPAAQLLRRPTKDGAPASSFALWLVGGGTTASGMSRDPRVLQTPAASSLLSNDGDGVARFRLIDINAVGKTPADAALSTVFPIGGLRIAFDAANDGSAEQVGLTAMNQHGTGLARLSAFVRVKKTGSQSPWVRGATLESSADLGTCWECRVGFDLPEKSTLRAIAGTGAPAAASETRIGFNIPSQIPLSTPRGLLQAPQAAPLEVTITNLAGGALHCAPLVRLDGDVVPWRSDGRTRDFVLTAQICIQPRDTLKLRLDFGDARVRPGRRSLILYVNDGSTLTPVIHEFDAVPTARQ